MRVFEVDTPMAEFFMNLCRGETSGHMAMIPNNPTMYALCQAYEITSKHDFAKFLKMVAVSLEK
jgi:hypothetical protein